MVNSNSHFITLQRLRTYRFFKHLILVFMVAYLLGFISNMFFIPRYTIFGDKTHTIAQQLNKIADCQNLNFLRLIDKSTLDNDQSDFLVFLPKCILLLFMGLSLLSLRSIIPWPQSNPYYNHRYSYLMLRTFRI
jgi:hypothetical protein